jgi:hypothetical protein
MAQELSVVTIKKEIEKQLATPETVSSLLATTFKGFEAPLMKQALMEGMMRGFSFTDFLQKNIYAIKYGNGYNLVTSIDYARKVAMRSGVQGISEPRFTYLPDGKVESCTITVIKTGGGEFSATVFFDEFYRAGKTYQNVYTPGLWDTKPRVMISKVAEMHALRKAFPEEMSKMYVEEEREKEALHIASEDVMDLTPFIKAIESAKTLQELKDVWSNLPGKARVALENKKEEMKAILTTEAV